MIFLARFTLTTITAIVHVVDWIADRFEYNEELPEFLRDDHRPLQVRGRPRKSW